MKKSRSRLAQVDLVFFFAFYPGSFFGAKAAFSPVDTETTLAKMLIDSIRCLKKQLLLERTSISGAAAPAGFRAPQVSEASLNLSKRRRRYNVFSV